METTKALSKNMAKKMYRGVILKWGSEEPLGSTRVWKNPQLTKI